MNIRSLSAYIKLSFEVSFASGLVLLLMCASSCQTSNHNDTSQLLQAKAKIEHISKGRVTSHGYTGDRISVSYKPKGSNTVIFTEADVKSNHYKVGDSLTIFYNPETPEDKVKTLEK